MRLHLRLRSALARPLASPWSLNTLAWHLQGMTPVALEPLQLEHCTIRDNSPRNLALNMLEESMEWHGK